MKPRLSKLLIAGIIACYSNVAFSAGTITINDSSSTHFEDTNLYLNGNVTLPTWGIDWLSNEDNPSEYTLTGNGIISFNHSYGTDGDIYIEGNSTFTISSGITLRNTLLGVSDGARVVFEGGIDNTNGLSTNFCVYSPNNMQSIIDLTGASIRDSDKIVLEFERGTIIRPQYMVTDNHQLEVWNTVSNTESPGFLSLFDGDLTLAANGKVLFAITDLSSEYDCLLISGQLSVTGNTIIDFFTDDVNNFITPEPGTIIFISNSFSGDLSLLSLVESSWLNDEGDDISKHDIVDKKLISVIMTDSGVAGMNAIVVAEGKDTPGNPGTIITDGKASGILSDQAIISLSSDHEVDATEVTGGLNNHYVKGTGGSLLTSGDQTFNMSGSDTIGYSIIGLSGNVGADMVIGKENGSISDATIGLVGDIYQSSDIHVKSGIIEVGASTVLGMDDSLLTVGVSYATGTGTYASVNNRGTIANDVVLHSGASLNNTNTIKGSIEVNSSSVFANNGTINGAVNIQNGGMVNGTGLFSSYTNVDSGGLLYIGSSPGFQRHENLTFNGGSRLGFYLDGITAATLTNHGTGTYSNLVVNNSMTVNGMVNTEVEIGLGILAAGTDAFTLNLIKTDGTVSGSGDFQLSLNDENHLLKEGTLLWDSMTGTLSFAGQVDEAVAAALVGKDGSNIANSLWSSTSVVKSFGQTATSQLKVAQPGDSNVWVSGLGDFVTMNSTSHADGFQYNGGGYATGIDYSLTRKFRAGIAFGQTFGTFKSDDNQVSIKQDSIMTGLYANYLESINDKQCLGLSGYFAYGSVENRANTLVGNSAYLPGHAKWNDDVFTFGLKADWNIKVTDTTTLTPFIGIDYVHGSQESFTETYSNGSRQYRDGSMQVWSVPVGVTAKTEIAIGEGQLLLPELTVAYVGDVSRTNPSVKSTIYGIDNKHEGSNPGRSAFMLNTGTNWIINQNWSVGAFYTLEARSNQISQSGSLSARYSF